MWASRYKMSPWRFNGGIMIYTAEEERDFLKNHLGPIMEQSGYGDKNIVVWDHNRDLMAHRANVIFGDPEASKYAWV